MEESENFESIDFENWGGREITEAMTLLKLWQEDKFSQVAWDNFDHSGKPKVCFNLQSGMVFLTDDDYQVVIEENNKLVFFVVCGDCGNEGSESEFDPVDDCQECDRIANEVLAPKIEA